MKQRKNRLLLKKTASDEFETSGAVFISGDKTHHIFLSAAVKMLPRSAAILLRKRLLRAKRDAAAIGRCRHYAEVKK